MGSNPDIPKFFTNNDHAALVGCMNLSAYLRITRALRTAYTIVAMAAGSASCRLTRNILKIWIIMFLNSGMGLFILLLLFYFSFWEDWES